MSCLVEITQPFKQSCNGNRNIRHHKNGNNKELVKNTPFLLYVESKLILEMVCKRQNKDHIHRVRHDQRSHTHSNLRQVAMKQRTKKRTKTLVP